MDFILALPMFYKGFDTVISITYKFNKKIILIPEKATHGAKDWAALLLLNLLLTGWGILIAILNNRDRKFLSKL